MFGRYYVRTPVERPPALGFYIRMTAPSEDIATPPEIVDCGSSWRVDYRRGPATLFAKRAYPTRSHVRAILDAAATGPDVIIWPSPGQKAASQCRRNDAA